MSRLYVRTGVDPGEPDLGVAVLVVDPRGTPGERAVARLGGYCYEGDGAVHLVRTDGWAEREADGDLLRTAVVAYPNALRQVDVDPAEFGERSAVDPRAVVLLRAEAAGAGRGRLSDATAVFTAGPGTTVEELLASDEWPMVLAPAPEE